MKDFSTLFLPMISFNQASASGSDFAAGRSSTACERMPSGTVPAIGVSVAPPTCSTQGLPAAVDPATGIRSTRGRDAAQAYNLVHVYADTVLHSVVPASGGETVGRHVAAEDVERVLAEHGVTFPADDGAVRRTRRAEGVGPATGMIPTL